jgi:hypothetical protein
MTEVTKTPEIVAHTAPAVIVRDEAQRPTAARTRAANFGGPSLKLSVPQQIPGFHLYWENDAGEGKIENLLENGFDFVTPAEVGIQSRRSATVVADSELDSRVSRFVGRQPDGSPMRAYLLKCPEDIWAEYEADRNEQADAREDDIRQRVESPGAGNYKPNGYTSTVATRKRA